MPQISELINLFNELQNASVFQALKRFSNITISGAGSFASKAFILADTLRYTDSGPILWLVNDVTEQENVYQACREWLPSSFTAEKLDFSTEVEYEKKIRVLKTLTAALENHKKVFILPYQQALTLVPDVREVTQNSMQFSVGDKISPVEMFERLIASGYEVSDDDYLTPGTYRGKGDVLNVFPVNSDHPLRIEFDFDSVADIFSYAQEEGEVRDHFTTAVLYPLNIKLEKKTLIQYFGKGSSIIDDELEVTDEFFEEWEDIFSKRNPDAVLITFSSFPEDAENHRALRYLSVLKFQDLLDLSHDMKEKSLTGWRVVFFTKHGDALRELLKDKNIQLTDGTVAFSDGEPDIRIIDIEKEDLLPHSFQSGDLKLFVASDREVANLREEKKRKISERIFWEFLTTLKPNDLVVHINHGIARFEGLEKRTVDNVTREYMKLGYLENDKLFVPIDQADKVNKFVGSEDEAPKLTRLGSAEWATLTKKVRKETEVIARELLTLYAARKKAERPPLSPEEKQQHEFEKSFEYEETPGQRKAIQDVYADLERPQPMDRLVCGDVGFGKTEVAMRAAFKIIQSGQQVALISPITILADQHYRSFRKRMDEFNIRVDVLSRFRTQKEQKEVLKKMKNGEVDIVVGTHRLLQKDIVFKNLGLVVVDEEQRFGVKQKEQFKKMRTEVNILTLTATPIPRTLNICLNKLRDISTITTPPPGRLPVITEVRRYSNELIREAILRELKRGGQIYFLHNRVQTIEAVAERLRQLVPEARFCVAHGKLNSHDLEERIIDFKEHKFDVLVSSTIIENGIDLANANTLIVNNADKFGLAQLYQLRGRVGRSRNQAYAYFLYHTQRLRLDAKKRLRAIVEASELGAGFQIAMKDLEIRGAGDILGVNQHGVINVVGVSHFIRMLNKAVEDLQSGKQAEAVGEEPEVAIELPMTSYIPDDYIVNSKEKINVYQRMAAADGLAYLDELKEDVIEDFGKMPREVSNLFRVIEMKILSKKAGITVVKAENIHMRTGKHIVLHMSKYVKPENIVYMLAYNAKWEVSGTKLRINIEDLGLNWFDELKECIKMLGEKIDKNKMASDNEVAGSVAV